MNWLPRCSPWWSSRMDYCKPKTALRHLKPGSSPLPSNNLFNFSLSVVPLCPSSSSYWCLVSLIVSLVVSLFLSRVSSSKLPQNSEGLSFFNFSSITKCSRYTLPSRASHCAPSAMLDMVVVVLLWLNQFDWKISNSV